MDKPPWRFSTFSGGDSKDSASIYFQIDLIESKIEIETQLLNKYEEQKKFLLSNMFI